MIKKLTPNLLLHWVHAASGTAPHGVFLGHHGLWYHFPSGVPLQSESSARSARQNGQKRKVCVLSFCYSDSRHNLVWAGRNYKNVG